MTDKNHPITPPPELVEKWECEYHHMTYGPDLSIFISEKAAHWGADMELDACCEHLKRSMSPRATVEYLRAARRPKQSSLKKQALKELAWVDKNLNMPLLNQCDAIHTIRRALESLPD